MLIDKKQWMESVVNSDRLNKIWDKIPVVQHQRVARFDYDPSTPQDNFTPRETSLVLGELDLQPFYILDFISNQTDQTIYDIGCGFNLFKHFYNVIGIDPSHDAADIRAGFSDEFVADNLRKFDAAISINAIHFCNVHEFERRVHGFFNLIVPHGYGYLAINTQRVVERTNDLTKTEVIDIIRNVFDGIVKKTNNLGETIYFEDLIDRWSDEGLNGNMRLLLKRDQ